MFFFAGRVVQALSDVDNQPSDLFLCGGLLTLDPHLFGTTSISSGIW